MKSYPGGKSGDGVFQTIISRIPPHHTYIETHLGGVSGKGKNLKTLSIKQPWADMIVKGFKKIENRTWKSGYRGPLQIHAGKTFDKEGAEWIMRKFPAYTKIVKDSKKHMGGIVGSVVMTDCVTDSSNIWFAGPYGFVFKNAEQLPFFNCNGKLSFFDIDRRDK